MTDSRAETYLYQRKLTDIRRVLLRHRDDGEIRASDEAIEALVDELAEIAGGRRASRA